MTLTVKVDDAGRTTVALSWKREWDDPGNPTSHLVTRCTPPAAPVIVARIVGRKFIDPNCQPNTTYLYEVTAIGLPAPEVDSIQVTTRPPTEFPNWPTFFTEYLSKTFARSTQSDALRWCPQPWLHPEAEEVVNALWRAYEAHRPPDDPFAPSTERAIWLAVYAYPLLNHLWALEGTFKDCSHRRPTPAHTTLPPPPLAG